MSQTDLMLDVIRILAGAGIQYMITGSFASSIQGEPRATHDVDLLVEVNFQMPQALASALGAPRYCFDAEAAQAAMGSRSMFQLIDMTTGDKVDFWVLAQDPFDTSRFERRVVVHALGVELCVSSPEDTILQKLRWSRASGGSQRQLNDALGVYEFQFGELDEVYLDHWAAKLGVGEDLEWIRANAVHSEIDSPEESQ